MTEWDLAYMRRRVQPTDADLSAENARLREAIQHYEAALKQALPGGAQGRTLDHWNSARIAVQGSQP
jgi:hypothetical protein